MLSCTELSLEEKPRYYANKHPPTRLWRTRRWPRREAGKQPKALLTLFQHSHSFSSGREEFGKQCGTFLLPLSPHTQTLQSKRDAMTLEASRDRQSAFWSVILGRICTEKKEEGGDLHKMMAGACVRER